MLAFQKNYYLQFSCLELIPIEIMPFEEISSGSGNMEFNPLLPTETTLGARITDFNDTSATPPGQLYAYRFSNTSAVLGTRSAVGVGIQMAIGLLSAADGVYRCVVENFASGRNESKVRIQTIKSK